MTERVRELTAKLRTQMRYGTLNEALRAAYALQLEIEIAPDWPEKASELERIEKLITRLETDGLDPLERSIGEVLDTLSRLVERWFGRVV